MMENNRSMNNDRVKKIIDAYGGVSDNWPAEERDAALDLVSASDELQKLQRIALDLDGYIQLDSQLTTITARQANNVATRLYSQAPDKSETESLLKRLLSSLLIPRYALAFSLLLSTAVVLYMSQPAQQQDELAQVEFDSWMLSQVMDIDVDDRDSLEFDFMELVELEVEAGSNI